MKQIEKLHSRDTEIVNRVLEYTENNIELIMNIIIKHTLKSEQHSYLIGKLKALEDLTVILLDYEVKL